MDSLNRVKENYESYQNSILELYDTCKISLLTKPPLSPPFSNIVNWMFENFDLTPLHLTYISTLNKLILVFKDENDLKNFILKTEHKFKTVPSSMKHYQLFLEDVSTIENEFLNYEYLSFKSLAKRYIALKSDLSIFHNELNINSLWKIYGLGETKIVLFFYSQSEAEKYEKSENMDHLINKYLYYLKKNDEFDILDKSDLYIIIDTKENFEVNYLSSMQFYFKDH